MIRFCLRHCVDLQRHAALLAGGVVLVKDSLIHGLIDSNNGCGVGSAGRRYAVETTAEYVDTLWPRMTLTENLLGEKLRYTA